MNKNLKSLKPELLWKHFDEICKIPHPSHDEAKIRQYIKDFAAAHNYDCKEDEAHNLYIRKEATKGMENRKGIIIQAHLDMVPQKNNDKTFDFAKDSIEAYIDGDWVTANGTTLGADNGIGAAAILAILEDKSLQHGTIEALFTATEETGMDGAFGLKAGVLTGDILLNLDSETEGELYVGCAGGMDANISFDYTDVATPASGYKSVEFTVKGFKGGHSGIQIITQRGNANKIMFRFLRQISKSYDMHLCNVSGGSLRNAIAREAVATLLIAESQYEAFVKDVAAYEAMIIKEFDMIEDSIHISATPAERPSTMIPDEVTSRLTKAIVACPDGVQRMSVAMPGLVQTSTNLARVESNGKNVTIQCLMRSSMNSEKVFLGESMSAVFELAGASIELSGSYDGWNPNMNSAILKTMRESYKALYGKEPEVMAIHAGLECGIIGGKYPNMDMISFGPTICYPHSPDEKVEIASVAKFYEFLLHTLKNAPAK